MEAEIIKKSGKYYYDGELSAGKLLKSDGENEINVNKFDAVKIGERVFLLNPTTEEFVNLQIRDGQYEYIYKSGDKFIVRDSEGNEIMPMQWLQKGMQVMTSEGLGTIEVLGDQVALIKSEQGLKNYYVKNLKPADDKSEFQRYRESLKKYQELIPEIQTEIKSDNTKLLKGAFDEAFQRANAAAPKKIQPPEIEAPEVKAPKVDKIKAEVPSTAKAAPEKTGLLGKLKNLVKTPDPNAPKILATPPSVDVPDTPKPVQEKTGLLDKLKNFIKAPEPNAPKIFADPEPEPEQPPVNVHHDTEIPAPVAHTESVRSHTVDHSGIAHTFTDSSNMEGQANHVLTHVGLNPESVSDKDKYLYHYHVGDHKDPIVTDKYLNPLGKSKDEWGQDIQLPKSLDLANGIYVPGESVIDKSTGQEHEVVSHIDHNHETGVSNHNNMLVKDAAGNLKSINRGDAKLSSADRTKHTIVKTDAGNKHLHDLKEGDVINHEGHKHSVLYADHKKGMATVNQTTGKMNFVSARDYHKPYLGEAKPEVKEGHIVQIGKQQYKVEHVGGDEKGMSILSATDKLGNKTYHEHPTAKLYDKILKPADLQDYDGDTNFNKKPKTTGSEGEETKPVVDDKFKEYTAGIDSAETVLEQDKKHPTLTEEGHQYLKDKHGLTSEEINKMSPDEVMSKLTGKPVSENPMPETATPEKAEEEKRQKIEGVKKQYFDDTMEKHDKLYGAHNKTETEDGAVHNVGIGGLGIKTKKEGGTEIVNPEVPLGKNKIAVVHDINTTTGKVTFRMKGDDPGDRKKYKERNLNDFKTHVAENEKLEPVSDAEVKSRQVKHKGDFQEKTIQSVTDHFLKTGLEPTKENIDLELKTTNGALRQEVEKHFQKYEKNHNKEKSKGSIVAHPEYDKLDLDKHLNEIKDIDKHVGKGITEDRGYQKEQVKRDLALDIAKEYHSKGMDYDEKPDAEATHEDFTKHRNLGGSDEEIHNEVRKNIDKFKEQDKVEKSKKETAEKQKQASLSIEQRAKMSGKDYLDNVYNKKDDIKTHSINEQHGVSQDRGKLAFNNNPTYHNTEFEYHIVPRSKVTVSHTAEKGDPKAPFIPNPEHPSSGQGREGYHSLNIKGETDRKKVMEIADKPEHDQLINTSRSASDQAPPLIDAKGNAINNGRFMGMDMTSPENKQAHVDYLKSKLPEIFPNATPEQHEAMKASIDEHHKQGDMPMLTRVPHNKTDNAPYHLGSHGEDYGKFASATNESNIKSLDKNEKIKTVQNALSHEDKKEFHSLIPENTTVARHITNVKKADEILDLAQKKGILSDTERSTHYGEDRRLNDEGKKFIKDLYDNMYFGKEHNDLAEKNKTLAQPIIDFQKKHSDHLREVHHYDKAYDLQGDLTKVLKSHIVEKGQLEGQERIDEDSKTVKGLKYLMQHGQKGVDSEGKPYDDQKEAMERYVRTVKSLKDGGSGMFGVSKRDQDVEGLKDNFFDKYAKLYDAKKKSDSLKSQDVPPVEKKKEGKKPKSDGGIKKSFEGLQKSHLSAENISSIAVMNGDKILMGRRRDSDKWTLPGGHAEENETPEETGLRELEEETGIKADKLKSLGSEEVQNPNSPKLNIHCFKYETGEGTSMRDDPDTEVKKWVWISTPINKEILNNLHAKKNVTLKLLGLQEWE